MISNPCPCGHPQSYDLCCGLYIDKGKLAPTPEQLMRSRYTAFTLGNADYIGQTMREEALKNYDAEETKKWALSVEWDKLEVLGISPLDAESTQGFVQFIAYFKEGNNAQQIRELSEFKQIDGSWYYTSTAKLGRNEACFCGSTKKSKKCHPF